MAYKTIKVSYGVWHRLAKMKIDSNKPSIDAVLKELLGYEKK